MVMLQIYLESPSYFSQNLKAKMNDLKFPPFYLQYVDDYPLMDIRMVYSFDDYK